MRMSSVQSCIKVGNFFSSLRFIRATIRPVQGFFIPFVAGWSYVWAQPRPIKSPFFIPFVVGRSYVWVQPRPIKRLFFHPRCGGMIIRLGATASYKKPIFPPLGDRQINRNTGHCRENNWQTRNQSAWPETCLWHFVHWECYFDFAWKRSQVSAAENL
jgi:hypothetical protein